MCGGAAKTNGWMDPGLLHTAVMTQLKPATRYYYVYGDSFGWSAEQSFVSAPVVGPDSSFNMVAYGDMGKGELDGSQEHWEEIPSLNTTRLVMDNELATTDLLLHIGDIAYAVRAHPPVTDTHVHRPSHSWVSSPWVCGHNTNRWATRHSGTNSWSRSSPSPRVCPT